MFHRYHEADKTYIRNLDKLCKTKNGYDVNALYLWEIAQKMPVGKHKHITGYDLDKLNADILCEKSFGFVKVDIKTPDDVHGVFLSCLVLFYGPIRRFYLKY